MARGPVVLDDEQAAAVVHRDGPLLVVGGPGTGKTTTLVEAVAARVAEGVEPDRVLVLTFGRRAANRLRDRIEAVIGGGVRATAEPVVRTFPAYAFGLLRQAAALAGEPAPRLLTGPEQDAVIRDLLATAGDEDDPIDWPASLRSAVRTRAFAAELRDLILRAAERGVGADDLAALGHRLRRADWLAAARFMREYRHVLALRDMTTRGSVAYDPAELVRAAGDLLDDEPELLLAERARFRAVFVDELADTDPAQLELLARVAGGVPLVAFADPDSSTFAFRGADPTGVYRFTDTFRHASGAEAATLVLRHNYRSDAELVAATRRVAARLRGPAAHRRLTAVPADSTIPASVEVCVLRSVTSEAAFIAHRLREAHLHHGVPWSRMAVIVRSTHLSQAPLLRALTQAGVPVTTGAEDTALATQPAIAPLLLLLRCALEPGRLDEEAVVSLLHSPLGGADPFTERQLRQALRQIALAGGDQRPSGDLLIDALMDPSVLAVVEDRWARPARAVAGLLARAQEAAEQPHATAESVLWAVWHASGLADRWAALSARGGRQGAGADRDLDAVMVLFDAAARFTDRLPGARIDAFLANLLDQELPADTLAATADRGEAVRLLTAHAAKGLEWDVVAVAAVQEGIWPDLRLRGSVLGSERLVDEVAGRAAAGPAGVAAAQVGALLDEERRLFYVATTRARRALLVTAVDASSSGAGAGEEQPSRFLGELAGAGAVAEAEADELARFETADDEPGVPMVRLLPRPLTLPALVAELRTVVADPAAGAGRRAAAAARLAELAGAGVPGADPDDWWGLPELSDDGPLGEPGAPVRVSPSTVESVLRCGVRWLLERHGGSDPESSRQGVGNLLHGAAMLAEDATTDPEILRDYVAHHFDSIELAAVWLGDRERRRSELMVDKLLRWLAANPRRLVAIEREFVARLDPEFADDPEVELKGRVDRLEMDADGALVVIDLKTGKLAPTAEEAQEHAQLAAYQAAVEAGAFPEGDVAGGAEIVSLGGDSRSAAVRPQAPLAESGDPGWARAMVRRAAGAMAHNTFTAVVNNSCRNCPVRTSCPVNAKGRQVTGE
ncbi:ATP-dependent DNA helicase [Luedemannella helvata]